MPATRSFVFRAADDPAPALRCVSLTPGAAVSMKKSRRCFSGRLAARTTFRRDRPTRRPTRLPPSGHRLPRRGDRPEEDAVRAGEGVR
jgi:hypothetical protein